MITIEKLREQFISAYEGGDPETEDMKSRWSAYMLCARLNGIIPFELPRKYWSIK
jgi:hypothetical protein